MNTKRIDQYNLTFNRLITNYKENDQNFSKQKIGSNISLYVGIFDGKYSIAIESEDFNIDLRSTSLIAVYKLDYNSKKAFIFSLNDSTLLPIFITFIVDLESILDEDSSVTFVQIYNRYLFWVKMFKSSSQNIPEKLILGLINEMNIIYDEFIPKFGIDKAITAWIGPDLLHKDFTFDTGVWFEAKAISVGKKHVTISSLEQLESNITGYLVVTEYEKTSVDNNEACSLFSVTNKINLLLINENIKDNFYSKIMKIGIGIQDLFSPDSEINKYRYNKVCTRRFIVGEEFPRLCRSDINSSIINATYDLQLDLLSDYEIENFKEIES